MSIPMLFAVDIADKEVLTLNAIVEVLKFVEEKENLFANFPIGATIQDGGKRKRSIYRYLAYPKCYELYIKVIICNIILLDFSLYHMML